MNEWMEQFRTAVDGDLTDIIDAVYAAPTSIDWDAVPIDELLGLIDKAYSRIYTQESKMVDIARLWWALSILEGMESIAVQTAVRRAARSIPQAVRDRIRSATAHRGGKRAELIITAVLDAYSA